MNPYGFAGAYQMGETALDDAGFYNSDGTKKNDYIGKWTDKAHKLNIDTISDYIGAVNDGSGHPKKEKTGKGKKTKVVLDPSKKDSAIKAQDEAVKAFYVKVWSYICAGHLDQYVGTTINGITITESGLIGGYHLVGRGYTLKKTKKRKTAKRIPGLDDYLKSNGKIDPTDANKTHISEYIKLFNDYDVPFKKGVRISNKKKSANKSAASTKQKWLCKPEKKRRWDLKTSNGGESITKRDWSKMRDPFAPPPELRGVKIDSSD
jgi:hypothetical protein